MAPTTLGQGLRHKKQRRCYLFDEANMIGRRCVSLQIHLLLRSPKLGYWEKNEIRLARCPDSSIAHGPVLPGYRAAELLRKLNGAVSRPEACGSNAG